MEITSPSHRYDIEIKEDVIEELARIIGYNNLPTKRLKLLASSSEDTSITVSYTHLTLPTKA